jgi:hypothetical protein
VFLFFLLSCGSLVRRDSPVLDIDKLSLSASAFFTDLLFSIYLKFWCLKPYFWFHTSLVDQFLHFYGSFISSASWVFIVSSVLSLPCVTSFLNLLLLRSL